MITPDASRTAHGPAISIGAVLVANVLFLALAATLCWLLFSLLPFSLAMLQFPVNGALLFSEKTRRAFTGFSYTLLICGVLVGLVLATFIAILGVGREHFDFLLDYEWLRLT